MLFFVKVRIDLNKMPELGRKLQSGELDLSNIKNTVCLKDDPAVGLSVWESLDKEEFEAKLEPFKEYYAEILEIFPVITPLESQKILMDQLARK
jgi:hypothetical protein